MLKQDLTELEKAINDAKKNKDPKDTYKVKLTEKMAKDILEYLKIMEDIVNKFKNVK